MGFLDYAWNISFQKDKLETKILLRSGLQQPSLIADEERYVVILPEPKINKEQTSCTFLGQKFELNAFGKSQIARLFRASVFHLTAHIMNADDQLRNLCASNRKMDYVKRLSISLIEDVKVNAYMSLKHADKLLDIAYANSLAFQRMRACEKIRTSATRIMAALLSQINVGMVKGKLRKEEMETVRLLTEQLSKFKEKALASLEGQQPNLNREVSELQEVIKESLEFYGPITEAPSLPHTEKIGPCTIFKRSKSPPMLNEETFKASYSTLGGDVSTQNLDSSWNKASEAEALQVFDSWLNIKSKEKKILAAYEKSLAATKFKSVEFPEKDYTEYLRTRATIGGSSRRLLDSLRVVADALDEDPRKEYGVLDLQETIQVIASKNPRTDVFMLDEYLSKSYAWAILLDASRSMRTIKGDTRVLTVCLVEAAKELLVDATSWGIYAFNDRFYIVKDPRESYSSKTKARLGGTKFEGLSYIPDALKLVGEILSQRAEELRIIIILSDGQPFGYVGIEESLASIVESLEKKGFIIIKVGVRMEDEKKQGVFKVSCSARTSMELIKRFSQIYVDAIRSAISG